jgi:hypothetical protein
VLGGGTSDEQQVRLDATVEADVVKGMAVCRDARDAPGRLAGPRKVVPPAWRRGRRWRQESRGVSMATLKAAEFVWSNAVSVPHGRRKP